MTQTKLSSASESVANVAVGYAVAMLTQALVFPLFGFYASTAQQAGIALIFTVVSLVRSYALRRLFNWMGERK